ncbi:MAG: DUF1294 domain-containing protein [Clostridia bacterium]|nr:DUF1294 domain-containing protein [Clostridia bacterium]
MTPQYIAYLSFMSILTFVYYVVDKSRAKRNAWRASEKLLLSLSFFGGAIGGYMAMFVARHKTRKWYFHVVNLIGMGWQIALLIYLL